MVKFVNTVDKLERAGIETKQDCDGPCHGLSANAMWSAYCATCPFRVEARQQGEEARA